MAIWDLLNGICLVMPVYAAFQGARHANAGIGGYALVIAIGLAMGIGCTFGMWTIGERIVAAVSPYPKSKQERYFIGLYVAAGLWLLVVALLADWVISASIHLIT